MRGGREQLQPEVDLQLVELYMIQQDAFKAAYYASVREAKQKCASNSWFNPENPEHVQSMHNGIVLGLAKRGDKYMPSADEEFLRTQWVTPSAFRSASDTLLGLPGSRTHLHDPAMRLFRTLSSEATDPSTDRRVDSNLLIAQRIDPFVKLVGDVFEDWKIGRRVPEFDALKEIGKDELSLLFTIGVKAPQPTAPPVSDPEQPTSGGGTYDLTAIRKLMDARKAREAAQTRPSRESRGGSNRSMGTTAGIVVGATLVGVMSQGPSASAAEIQATIQSPTVSRIYKDIHTEMPRGQASSVPITPPSVVTAPTVVEPPKSTPIRPAESVNIASLTSYKAPPQPVREPKTPETPIATPAIAVEATAGAQMTPAETTSMPSPDFTAADFDRMAQQGSPLLSTQLAEAIAAKTNLQPTDNTVIDWVSSEIAHTPVAADANELEVAETAAVAAMVAKYATAVDASSGAPDSDPLSKITHVPALQTTVLRPLLSATDELHSGTYNAMPAIMDEMTSENPEAVQDMAPNTVKAIATFLAVYKAAASGTTGDTITTVDADSAQITPGVVNIADLHGGQPAPSHKPSKSDGPKNGGNHEKPHGNGSGGHGHEQAPHSRYDKLFEVIARWEGGKDYSSYYGKPVFHYNDNRDLTSMSVAEVLNWQEKFLAWQLVNRPDDRVHSTAVGRYQFLRDTLRSTVVGHGISLDTKFDKALQDRLAVYLLEKRELGAYLSGNISAEQFAHELSKEWASLPSVLGPHPEASYYDKDGANKAHISVAEIMSTVRSIKGEGGGGNSGHETRDTGSMGEVPNDHDARRKYYAKKLGLSPGDIVQTGGDNSYAHFYITEAGQRKLGFTDTYPADLKNAPKDSKTSKYRMFNRECVDWVAFRLEQTTGYVLPFGGYDNRPDLPGAQTGMANDWDEDAHAHGIKEDKNLTRHATLGWNSGGYAEHGSMGHQAFIEDVYGSGAGKFAVISQYNAGGTGLYSLEIYSPQLYQAQKSQIFVLHPGNGSGGGHDSGGGNSSGSHNSGNGNGGGHGGSHGGGNGHGNNGGNHGGNGNGNGGGNGNRNGGGNGNGNSGGGSSGELPEIEPVPSNPTTTPEVVPTNPLPSDDGMPTDTPSIPGTPGGDDGGVVPPLDA